MHPFYVDKTSFSYARRIEALDEGFNVLMAVADTVKDSITLEKGYRSICGCSGIPFCMGAAGYTVQAQRPAPMTHRVLNNVDIQTRKYSIPSPRRSI